MNLLETIGLSLVMGLSIFLSLPIVLHRRTGETRIRLLTAVAIGILVFVMGDVFSNASASLYNGTLSGYGSSGPNDVVFAFALSAGFLILYLAGLRSKEGLTPAGLALAIAVGMGFQNLTEGLVFGSLGVTLGLSGAALVVLVGFVFQNITEGFPIASPFLGRTEGRLGIMVVLCLIGGLPAAVGGAVGFFYNSAMLDLAFDGVAIGAILYAVLPMLKGLFKDGSPDLQRLGFLGVFIGFLLGFLVNLV